MRLCVNRRENCAQYTTTPSEIAFRTVSACDKYSLYSAFIRRSVVAFSELCVGRHELFRADIVECDLIKDVRTHFAHGENDAFTEGKMRDLVACGEAVIALRSADTGRKIRFAEEIGRASCRERVLIPV